METLEKPTPPRRGDTLQSNSNSTTKQMPPLLPPRTTSSLIYGSATTSNYSTLPRHIKPVVQEQQNTANSGKKQPTSSEQTSSASSSSSASPAQSSSPVNTNINQSELLSTPPPMPLILTSPNGSSILNKSRRKLSFAPPTSANLETSLFANRPAILMTNIARNNLSTGSAATDFKDFDSMLCDLNKQLNDMLTKDATTTFANQWCWRWSFAFL